MHREGGEEGVRETGASKLLYEFILGKFFLWGRGSGLLGVRHWGGKKLEVDRLRSPRDFREFTFWEGNPPNNWGPTELKKHEQLNNNHRYAISLLQKQKEKRSTSCVPIHYVLSPSGISIYKGRPKS